MSDIIYEIFYSQWFSFLIAFLSGIIGYVYFEVVNNLNLEWKYAVVLGLISLAIGAVSSFFSGESCTPLNALVFNCEYRFSNHKFILIGYSFLVYSGTSLLIFLVTKRNKKNNVI